MKKDRKRLQAPNFPIVQAEICLCDSDRCNNADLVPEVRLKDSKTVITSRAQFWKIFELYFEYFSKLISHPWGEMFKLIQAVHSFERFIFQRDWPMSRHFLTFLTKTLKAWEQISSHFRISTLFSLAVHILPHCFLWVMVTKVIMLIVMIIIRDKMVEDRQGRQDRQNSHYWQLNLTFQATCDWKLSQSLWCFYRTQVRS